MKKVSEVKNSRHRGESDGRNQIQQLQSQEKKAGDRQSVPNIDEDSLTVQLPPMAAEQDNEDLKSLNSAIIMTDADELDPKTTEDRIADTLRTQRRDGHHLDASKEVRNLLEFLYLDVKVRSPAEIADLTDTKLV